MMGSFPKAFTTMTFALPKRFTLHHGLTVLWLLGAPTASLASPQNQPSPTQAHKACQATVLERAAVRWFNQQPTLRGTSSARRRRASAAWLGYPYQLGPLGEGCMAPHHRQPRLRVDRFDCQTYVMTTLAWSLCSPTHRGTLPGACVAQVLQRLNYQGRPGRYTQRLHLTAWQWNPNLQRLTHAEDWTGRLGKLVSTPPLAGQVTVRPRAWLKRQRVPLPNVDQHLWPDQAVARITYVRLVGMLKAYKHQGTDTLASLQGPMLLELVHPQWPSIAQRVGTPLLVSHMGWVLKSHGRWVFRHASSKQGRVVEAPLWTYLQQVVAHDPNAGVHLMGWPEDADAGR